jgi:acyl-coenzyme A thioesterase PaaI-like protein
MSSDFATHTGPVVRDADGNGLRFTLRLETRHLNFSGRFHGGMVMALHNIAMSQVATDIARRAGDGASAPLLSLNCDFIGAAEVGAEVRADVTVTRATRSVVFLACRLSAGEQLLSTASAVHKLDPGGAEPATRPGFGAMPDGLSAEQGWSEVSSREPFAWHVGPTFERRGPDGITEVRFGVDERRLDPHRAGRLHDGMTLYVADFFTGRTSTRAATRPCVTLSMNVRRFADAMQGELVDFVATVQAATPSVVFTDGHFHSGGRLLMSISSAWKILGAP